MGYFLVIARLLFLFRLSTLSPTYAQGKSYVVYLGSHPHHRGEENRVRSENITAAHHELLGRFLDSKEKAREAIFYSYTKFINGFAAILADDEAEQLSKSNEVLAVFPSKARQLQTTRSWQFLGLENDGAVSADSLWTQARYGEDTIIANIDTGVWPESASFNDEGLSPVPSRWRGICETGPANPVKCNRKLIGARFFYKGFEAAESTAIDDILKTSRDQVGHGTHTLATAGGAFVPHASLFGFGDGTAKGGSPRARVAAYRVCWRRNNGRTWCYDADILAAFDAAIHDGVDVISISLGGGGADYFNDGISLGSFHAVKSGISVICSAGNGGPYWSTVENVAPWIFTVAASTMDREFSAYLTLGNGERLKGESLSAMSLRQDEFRPLILSDTAASLNSSLDDAHICAIGSLDPQQVKGKIVVCSVGKINDVTKSESVLLAGGVGMILVDEEDAGNNLIPAAFLLPAISISYEEGFIISSYIKSAASPVASISSASTVLGTQPAPIMAYFSSRGPNTVNYEILKPDITAPGVSVLAAFTGAAGPSNEIFDERRVPFTTISGTSMSCPHVSGIVGLLKTLHPDWSPAAIKSAIMTTATTEDNRRKPILDSGYFEATPFSYGAGHVQPNRAADPGLIYDLTVDDYLHFLCANGYNSSQLAAFSEEPFSCRRNSPKIIDLNYPSITVPRLLRRVTIHRKVKNVGSPGTYTARVIQPKDVTVTVIPDSLEFERIGEEKAFSVTFEVRNVTERVYAYGSLTWSDILHNVTSPLVVEIDPS